MGVQTARVIERLGNPKPSSGDEPDRGPRPRHPRRFPEAVLAEAEAAKEPDLKRREDLRHIPLVTIDPSDARDHDDAVWAEADPDPDQSRRLGGDRRHRRRRLLCAARQRARPEARKRGNSVYFPDRVVPMLPERISNDLCSLNEDERRAPASPCA